MKRFFQNLLAFLSRKIISKYQPIVIGVTGSVGKTSTKEAIFDVISQKYRTRRSEKNFNNEFGLPLTVIGINDAPGKNPFKWLQAIFHGLSLLILKHRYPQALVLEMGVDRVGDMDYLLSIARPHIAVITTIGLSHYKFFKDLAATCEEKGRIAEILKTDDFLIVNADNKEALDQKRKTVGRVLTYGVKNTASVQLVDVSEKLESHYFTKFTVQSTKLHFESFVKAVGQSHLSAIAAACAVAEALEMESDLVIKGIQEYKPTPGRLSVIAGIKHSLIIDDSYNAAPDSVAAALELFSRFPGNCKIAVLGDMLELGSISDEAHLKIGKLVAGLGINRLVTVGESGKLIAKGARDAGMDSGYILSFDTSNEARKPIQEMLQQDNVLLIKGSQGMRMEKITKEIMAEPMRANELLCRQYGKWIK